MKLTSLLVITLLVLGCGAAFGQTFGFLSAGGIGEYCNYEQLTNNGADTYTGIDNTTAACGYPLNGTIGGFGVSVPASLAAGLPVTGKGVVYGDNIYDAGSEEYTGEQWSVFTQLHASRLIGHYGWVGIASFSGFFVGDNYGFLTNNIPTGEAASRGTSAGKTNLKDVRDVKK